MLFLLKVCMGAGVMNDRHWKPLETKILRHFFSRLEGMRESPKSFCCWSQEIFSWKWVSNTVQLPPKLIMVNAQPTLIHSPPSALLATPHTAYHAPWDVLGLTNFRAHKVTATSIWPLGADFCSYWVRQWRLRCTPLGLEVHMAIRLESFVFWFQGFAPCHGPVHQHAHSSKGWSYALTTRLSQNSWILRATLNLSLLTPSIHRSRGMKLLKKCVHCYRGRWEWEPKVTERWGQLRSKVNGEAQICKNKTKMGIQK